MSDYEIRTPPDRPLSAWRVRRRKAHLMREVARAHRVSYRRRLGAAVAAAAALLVVTGFGAYTLMRDDPTHVDSIGCYAGATFEADLTVIENTAQDPVAACAELWRSGSMEPGNTVPPLQACVLQTGAIAVMPARSPDVCNALGIARLSDAARAEFRRLGALHAALVERLGTASGSRRPQTPCPDKAEARRIARAELDARGFGSWAVETTGTFEPRNCPSPTIDRDRRVVLVIGLP